MWALVRKVTKQKAGPKAAPVLHDAEGRVAGSKEEIAELMADMAVKDGSRTFAKLKRA